MKKFLSALFAIAMLNACDINIYTNDYNKTEENTGNKNDETPAPESVFERTDLYGTWKITHAKFDEGAVMAEWEYEDTYATFKENGIYEGEGHWGNGEGTYSIENNTVTTFIDMAPYIRYEVLSLKENTAEIKATFVTTGQNVWVKCEKTEDTVKEPSVVYPSDNIYADENTARAATNHAYAGLRSFELYQHYIEYNAINNFRNELGIYSSLISKAWGEAYKTINRLNSLIQGLNSLKELEWTASYASQARALRAFIYYNLVVLWGDVPYLDETHDAMADMYPASTAMNQILEQEKASLISSIDNLNDSGDNVSYFSKNAAYMLLAEISLLQNSPDSAKKYLNIVDNSKTENAIFRISLEGANIDSKYKNLIWGGDIEHLDIYLASTIELYIKEADNEINDILTEWAGHHQYGYWAALKRMDKAQETTGCSAYETLMPFPDSEVSLNPNLIQNPGY